MLTLIQEVCTKKSYIYTAHYIHEYELIDIRTNIKEIESMIEKYTGDDSSFATPQFTVEQISNFLKQRRAIELVSNNDKDKDNYYMIIEDDCTIIPEFIPHFEQFLEKSLEWDILFLGMPDSSDEFELKDTRKLVKILPSKEIYCITPSCAKIILPLLQKIMFSFRFQLSYIIQTNQDIKVMHSTKRVSIEGSKFGFYPSSTVENNLLIYNKTFVEMFNMVTTKDIIDIEVINKMYQTSEYLESPEMMHIYGVLLHKCGQYLSAKKMFEKAIDQMKLKNGLISRRSELLNNAININSACQTIALNASETKN